MVEKSNNGKFLRTVLRTDIFDRLTVFAKEYANGFDKWDYGIAIQVLLDDFERQTNISQINDKLDYIAASLQPHNEELSEAPTDKESGISMLGGEKLK